jgi:hypothetical protein
MVSSRKRGREEMEAVEPAKEQSMIERIRNMWEFANLAQWIFTFGKAVKIDEDLDVEVSPEPPRPKLDLSRTNLVAYLYSKDLEMECMKSHSTVLSDIGLALLKFVSSHRGLTLVLSIVLVSKANS